ncbi:protein-disulfide reductase DsbD domain-containing protein [Ovoidimarina sediminis]|uniref:protein-disulfide reductase DsbD domain-containing protein n=1 Tax=Ovoidimarina sediminis TaxID=3079856 RepID=UPI002930CECA|nr:protein-disulfide reductase DsbD domain-containing protein [Rhodophyticola sp. MJ-SS7]
MRVLQIIPAALTAALLSAPAVAQGIADVVNARILPGWRMEDGRHMAAVRLALEPGWKTYWRAPGDAGIPPQIVWSGGGNVRGIEAHWPVPVVFWQNGMRSVGYKGEVVVPIEIASERAGEDIHLDARLDIGVCEDICVPVSLELSGVLPASGAAPNPVIRAALANRPMTADEAGVGRVVCATEPISDGIRVTVSVDMPRHFPEEETVVELADRSVWISEPETRRDGGRLVTAAEMVPPDAKPFAMARSDVRVTVLGGGQAVDIRGCTGS